MLRAVAERARSSLSRGSLLKAAPIAVSNRSSHGSIIPDEEWDESYLKYLNRTDIDHWEIRKAMTDIARLDSVPDPKLICAALRAARRLNDYALTIRFLEVVKSKCGYRVGKVYPYILQEIRPTLDELGISTIEELGYDEPELWLEKEEDVH